MTSRTRNGIYSFWQLILYPFLKMEDQERRRFCCIAIKPTGRDAAKGKPCQSQSLTLRMADVPSTQSGS
jgi:hypothetical protein